MRVKSWGKLMAVTTLCAVTALGDHGGSGRGNNDNNNNNNGNNNANKTSFASAVIGSTPASTVGGVASGGVPWITAEGSASLSSNGRLRVEVQGLLIAAGAGVPANLVGTVGPVQMVAASLVCGGSGGTVVQSTDGTSLSAGGNAEIEANITVPSTCAAPVILVRVFNNAGAPGQQLGPFIALTGLTNSGAAVKDDDDASGHH